MMMMMTMISLAYTFAIHQSLNEHSNCKEFMHFSFLVYYYVGATAVYTATMKI